MSELDKLEEYLKENGYLYDRIDAYDDEKEYWYSLGLDRHQIIVYDGDGKRQWDVICQEGSYGYSDGLLEAMGSPIVKKSDCDTVVGHLCAYDVIRRLESGNG